MQNTTAKKTGSPIHDMHMEAVVYSGFWADSLLVTKLAVG